MKKAAVFALLLCLLSSCSATEEAPSPFVTDEITPSSPLPPSPPETPFVSSLPEDEQELLRIVAAGKRFVSELQSGVEPSGKSEWQDGDAAAAFGRFLNMETLYVSGVFMDPTMPGFYVCMISGYTQYNYGRSVDVVFRGDDSLEWSCAMVGYYEQSDFMLDTYLRLLQDGDAEMLANWFGLDGPPSEAMIASAKDTLAYYQSWCDLSKLTVRENDGLLYDVYIRGFIYTIEDANGNTFQVETRIGDGFCFPVSYHRYY
ncbi:MAG: hypothetical protein LBI19_03115 [Oscillospiraceae bacterium]|nr:hypothetical protein [Oscillospiraceae bacterium]